MTEEEKIVQGLRMVQNFLYKLLEETQRTNKILEEVKNDIHNNRPK